MSYQKISDQWSVWVPDGPPQTILPPGVEPNDNILSMSGEEGREAYYMVTGRYQGVYSSKEEADKADPYEYARKYLPNGLLPWEK